MVEVTRPSADCQTTFFGRFKRLGNFFEKKSLKGHATVVGGHATRLPTVKQRFLDVSSDLGKLLKKVAPMVTRQWSEVTRPSADCQTTFSGRFKRFGKILKKVAERSRDSGRRSRDRRHTVKQRFLNVSSNSEIFLKKVAERSRDSGRRSRDRRPTVKQRFFRRFKRFGKILKKVAEWSRDSGRRSRDRWPTVKQRFLDVSSDLGKYCKKSRSKGHATVVRGHATVGRLSNNVFWTFQDNSANFFEKSR